MKVTKDYCTVNDRANQHKTIVTKEKVKIENIKPPCTLFIDQASNSGYCVFDSKSRLFLKGTIKRGRTSLPEYKKYFVKYLKELVEEYEITTIFHEEVYDAANMQTTEVLFYLKHAIQDLGYFTKDLEVLGLAHNRWKTDLPGKTGKFNFNRRNDKDEVVKWVSEIYPLLALTEQDEFDALGMGISVMIQGKGQKNFYKKAKYNKKLPINLITYENVFTQREDLEFGEDEEDFREKEGKRIEEYVSAMNKPYRDAYEAGGLFELRLERTRGVEDTFRRFLSHKDALTYIKIPKKYKYWGMYLLENNKSPEDYETENNPDGEYILIASRKNRL